MNQIMSLRKTLLMSYNLLNTLAIFIRLSMPFVILLAATHYFPSSPSPIVFPIVIQNFQPLAFP